MRLMFLFTVICIAIKCLRKFNDIFIHAIFAKLVLTRIVNVSVERLLDVGLYLQDYKQSGQ